MEWYYALDGEQKGPVADTEFQQLVSQGVIGRESLVWRTGMPDWQRYGQIYDDTSMAACAECGRTLPEGDMIRFGEQYICPTCKPIFVQKIREGLTVGREMRYAGFWIRFLAFIVDMIAMWVIMIPMSIIFANSFSPENHQELANAVAMSVILNVVNIALVAAYYTILTGRFGATLGKMACRIKVVKADGERVTYLRALGRYFATYLSSLILGIGFLMAGFDSQKRALHDRICGTRVIRK